MYIIPAIDLLKGKCVRLVQGEYHRQITYNDDPAEQTQQFIDAGADWLHVIDLDGARLGKTVNTEAISNIVALRQLKIEVGGGIREEDSIKQLLDMGVERIIIGTKAVTDFDWFSRMSEKFTGKLVLALDARGSKVSTHGWTKEHPKVLLEFVCQAAKLPLAAIIYTDIAKDGMMSGPNLKRTQALTEAVDIPVIASGGIKDVDDIKNLLQVGGIEAAIIGRALYEKTIDLAEAIKVAKQ